MLNKLIKYNLQWTYKNLVVFYILAIFFSVLTRIFFSIENSFIMDVIAKICSGVTISMIFNIIINNLIRLWVHFKNNFYGDESYLTHTLPITKKTLYLSKFIVSIITLFTSILVIGLTLFIAYYSKENLTLLKNLLLPVANLYNTKITIIIIFFLFVFFLEISNAVQAGYTGIILGYKMNNNKTAYSVLYGFIAYIVTQIFVLSLTFSFAIFNKDIMNLFYTNEMINIETLKLVIYLAIFIYTFTLIAGYIINTKLFNKGVNVD